MTYESLNIVDLKNDNVYVIYQCVYKNQCIMSKFWESEMMKIIKS